MPTKTLVAQKLATVHVCGERHALMYPGTQVQKLSSFDVTFMWAINGATV